MTELESVDESYQLFRIGGEFLGSKDRALRYTAVHSVDAVEFKLLIIIMICLCLTSEVELNQVEAGPLTPKQ